LCLSPARISWYDIVYDDAIVAVKDHQADPALFQCLNKRPSCKSIGSLKVSLHQIAAAQIILNHTTWDQFVAHHASGHLLQTWAWGDLKEQFGWRAIRLGSSRTGQLLAGAQILFLPIPPAFSLAYIPKGPLLDWTDAAQTSAFLSDLHRLCRSQRSVFLKIEPNIPDSAELRNLIARHGFGLSPFTVQPPRTILVDITPCADDILASMKQKTRYNIRLAARKGVTIRLGTSHDLPAFYRLMQITGDRDRFGIHSLDYFRSILAFFDSNQAALLLAEAQGEVVAGLIVLAHGATAYYLFGASSNAQREKMPTYLLQWEAMRWAKAHGYRYYDLWGIPDADEADLEAKFLARSQAASGLWGVYRFKRGFGGQVVRTLGAFDFVYNRPLHWLYRQWMLHRQRGAWS
jgi:peptidoglycan pentaglycine glycine transferase (the first glycine)